MRISRIHIRNFRCLRDVAMSLEDVTVLVGANSTGKSSVLHALAWFFDGGPLDSEDVSGHEEGLQVTVGVTFARFDDADREALGSYASGDEATFWRTWRAGESDKLTGKGRAYPGFAAIRQHRTAMPKRNAYNQLRSEQPELGLPTVRSATGVDEALLAWESAHPAQLNDERLDATHLFGFTGQARLAGRMDFVLIRAVSDPDAETTDARGTMLRQLLERALGEQVAMRERLSELERTVSQQMYEIMTEDGGAALDRLSESVTRRLAEFVPDREITLTARPPRIAAPSLSVALRVQDGNLDTAVSHQGHGFQRALLIAMVQQLADQQGDVLPGPDPIEAGSTTPPTLLHDADEPLPSDPPITAASPALFLAIEEPELYQHPLQARHFADSLASLAASTDATVQVAYATHSEHFVNPSSYQRLRRFRRLPGTEWPESAVTHATVERVAERVVGLFKPEQIALRVRVTLRRKLAEAVFAKAVLLVEGDTDAGLLQGVADRHQGLDALGIAVVDGHGKTQLMIPWAILRELGVPTYIVFDGDSGMEARMRASGKADDVVAAAVLKNRQENSAILDLLGAEPTEQPGTEVSDSYTVFGDNLEAELAQWEGFGETAKTTMLDQGGWSEKSYDSYREAAAITAAEPPAILGALLQRVHELGT